MARLFIALFFGMTLGAAYAASPQCAPAQHAKVPSIMNKAYHDARRALLKAGWQPEQTIPYGPAHSTPSDLYGTAADFWQQGYIEVESCAGTGLAPCSFLFHDAYGNRLRVSTEGEESPRDKAFATVSNMRFVCQ